MDDEAEYAERTQRDSVRWHWSYAAVQVLAFLGNVANAFRLLFGGLAEDVALHANYQVERDDFAAEAGREIETITEAPEEE